MAESILSVALIAGMILLCLLGLGLSAVSISGTWLVAAAAAVGRMLPGEPRYGWGLVLVFLALATLVEGAEAVAGAWGVRRRGGSRAAGVAALVGGMLGLLLGSFIPVPLVGSLIGMLAGSFGLVYWVEQRRLNHSEQAAHIAWGSVLGRMAMLLLKVAVTLGMIVWLALRFGQA